PPPLAGDAVTTTTLCSSLTLLVRVSLCASLSIRFRLAVFDFVSLCD
ncbi:hypothetical protein A2U01_0109844, partial [Trifolium medium]|nr:hypothetical protein [Trifolium medium]